MTTTELQTRHHAAAAFTQRALERAAERREPEWALAARRAAAAVFAEQGFPSREHELWRRTDFRALEEAVERMDAFASPPRARNVDDLPATIVERLAGESGQLGVIVQRDAEVVLEQTHPTLQRQGVVIGSLDRAMQEHGDLVKAHLGAMLEPAYDGWAAFGTAVRSGGFFVHVPKGVQAEVPVRVFQSIGGAGRVCAPRSVIVLEPGAQATVLVDQLSDAAEGESLYCGGIEVFVGDGARLVYGEMQDWGRNVFHYSNARARVGRDAELQWIQTMVGGRSTKANAWYNLDGSGAQAFVHGFMFGDQRQHFHLHTLQRHLKDHATSDLLIKGCLKDRARSVYQGLIQVAEGAQRTDAYQANRNLLLSDQARADSIPGLEILANDVRCTHGATLGHVDDEQMYYLMSRGLARTEAQRLIVEAFFEPVLERIPLESVRNQLRSEIERKIG